MLRRNSRGISKAKRAGKKCSYEKMMKTLLLQNQQIIIQQQNMMFMVMRQYQQQLPGNSSSQQPLPQQHQQQQPTASTTTIATIHGSQEQSQQHHHQNHHQHHQQQQQQHDQQKFHQIHHSQPQEQQQQQQQHHHHQTSVNSQQLSSSQQHQMQQQQQHIIHHQTHDDDSIQQQFISHHQTGTPTPVATTNSAGQPIDSQHQLQQVAQHLQDNMGGYMTPAASEQDPISDNKQSEDDLHALLEGDGLLDNNLLYNPEADTGSITPYKNHQQQHQTPSYYSSGCESLTTPRVEQPRQPTTTNISQNVVKNLADSFKSPTKPKINVQILSGSATRNLKNNKAKIIQTMNISEFLRQVHHDDGQKGISH